MLLALTACGGGGGGGEGTRIIPLRVLSTTDVAGFSVTKASTEPEGQNTLPLVDYSDSMPPKYTQTEYTNSPHLDTIKANYAYAEGLSGKGVTIGIVGRAMYLRHPEFYNKVIDYDQSTLYGGMDGYDEDEDHTTFVAALAAGAYNRSGGGMMGVAYNANIDLIARPSGLLFPYRNDQWAMIYSYFNARGSDTPVVNISSGLRNTINQIPTNNRDQPFTDPVDTITPQHLAVLRVYVQQRYPNILAALLANTDSVFVYAAGNGDPNDMETQGAGAMHPSLSSSFAALYNSLKPKVLVVVNADTTNGIDRGSHRCGITKEFCLGAPGERILSATNGGGYRRSSGTSFSAPIVSGAIALLVEYFSSQSMPSRKAAQRILKSANKDFDGYNENEVGQGILDIEAALNYMGMASLVATNGALLPLARSTLTLPAAFGDALQHTSHTLTFFDSLKTAFLTPLTNHLTYHRTLTLDTLLQQPTLTHTDNEQHNPPQPLFCPPQSA